MNHLKTITAYIGLGSNLENPVNQLVSARSAIINSNGLEEIAFSSFYSSPPMGPQDQPDYVNAVMALATALPVLELLQVLQQIEYNHGRIRAGQRWGARTLDLDILLYANQKINLPSLIVPHIGIAERAFVLYPLQEIAPDLVIPGKGPVAELVVQCPINGLRRLN